MNKINLGCGKDIKEGYINLDIRQLKGVNIVHDLNNYPWPFKNNSFDEVYCRDSIEHLIDLHKAMTEIKRICRKNAVVRIIVPYYHSSSALYPVHHFQFNVDTFRFCYSSFKLNKIKLMPSKLGVFIPPLPLPKKLFPNILNLRHMVSYLLGEIILKIDFEFRVIKD